MPEGGTLTVKAYRKEKKAIISVIDTGQGIPRENMKNLFEPLYTTKTRGVGLGLAISKRLADLNQAEITVKSKEGEGSVFSLELKAA